MLFLVLTITTMVLLNCDMTPAQKRDLAMCEPGYYAEALMRNSVYPCMPCSRCPPGQYQIRSCNATQDTVCASCPTNTYSDRWTSLPACKHCTICSRHQLSEACTSKKDTLCRTKCRTGYYFDNLSRRCKRCSLCPDVGGDRVYECTQQGGSDKYQCREGSVLQARTVYSYPPEESSNSPLESENQDALQTNLATSAELSTDFMGTDFSIHDKEDRSLPTVTERTRKVNLLMSTIMSALQTTLGGRISRLKSDPFLSVTSSSTPTSTVTWATTGLRHPSSLTSKRRGSVVTTSEVLMVLGIIVACGLTSFVTTYVTCHFLMKRGIVKSGDATVGFARGREPAKGWLAVPRGDVVPGMDTGLRRTSIDMI